MKRVIKVSMAFLLIIAVMLSCVSCQLRTTLNIDDNFKGERILELQVSKAEANELAEIEGVTDAQSFETLVKEECPEGMDIQSVARNGVGGYTVTFVIEFSSFEDYKSKIASVLGREPNIEYEKKENLFFPGYSLKEDFSSADLLKWASDKLVEKKALESADISDIVHSSTAVKLNLSVAQTSDTTKEKIDVDFVSQWELKHISMTTKILGNELFERSISFCIPENTIKNLTVEKIDEYFKSIAPVGSEFTWERSLNERYYIITFSALKSDLSKKTAAVLNIPVYAITYTKDSQAQNGFTFSYDYSETIDFSSWPINANKTCPVKLTYKTTDGSSLSEVEGWKLSGDMTTLSYESASASKVAIKFKNAATYTPSDINIALTQLGENKFSRSMAISFAETKSDNGANHLKEYLKHDMSEKMTAEVGKNATGNSTLTIKGEGTLKELSEMFSQLLGNDNTISSTEKRAMLIKKQISVVDSTSFLVMLRASEFEGNISYDFVTESGSTKDAYVTDMEGNVLQRLVSDKNTNKTSYKSTSQEFKVEFAIETYDWKVLIFVGAGLLLLIIIIWIISSAVKRKKKKEPKSESEIKSKKEKNVARRMKGASIENNTTANSNSNTIVVEPDYDDGLSQPDDESEGSWLLVNTIRILAVVAALLFFLPFATISISKAIVDKDAWITGFNMLFGGNISLDIFGLTGNIEYSGNLKSMILLLIPVVITLILSIRKWIKPTIAYIFTAVLSVAQLVYLISLPSYLESLTNAMKTNNNVSAITHELGFSYTWSIIIYIVIAAVLLFVIFAEFGRLRRISNSQNYEEGSDESEEILMLHSSSEESFEQDDKVNEIVESAIEAPAEEQAEEASVAIAMPEINGKSDEEYSAEQTAVEVAEPESEAASIEQPTVETEPIQAKKVSPKKIKAHVKPKRKKVVLPSQEEFDEHSGY